MLKIRHDFISYDQLDWANEFEVEIRFIVELLAHIYGKSTKHIVKVLCASDIDLPRLRYESSEIDDSSDPQWIRSRYCTVLHCKDLLSNTIEAERWTDVPLGSAICREEVKYKGANCPDAETIELIFETGGSENGIIGMVRLIRPDFPIPFDRCWASRNEFESFFDRSPLFPGWRDKISRLGSLSSGQPKLIGENPEWTLSKAAGQQWHCGPTSSPVLIRSVGGLRDLHYAIVHEGEDCAYAVYESESRSEEDQQVAATLQHSAALVAMEPEELGRIDTLIDKVQSDLEIAHEKGDIDAEEEAQAKLEHLIKYRERGTKPGGGFQTMADGDPNIKSAKAMRERKRFLLAKLREMGLNPMAENVEQHFKMMNRSFSYNSGPPFPKWTLY